MRRSGQAGFRYTGVSCRKTVNIVPGWIMTSKPDKADDQMVDIFDRALSIYEERYL